MADWTSGMVTIHSCPPHRVRPVLDTLEQYGLTDEDTAKHRMAVSVGESYGAPEFRVGDAIELAHNLIRRAPEVAFHRVRGTGLRLARDDLLVRA